MELAIVAASIVFGGAAACRDDAGVGQLERLVQVEERLLAHQGEAQSAALRQPDRLFGADPRRILALRDGRHLVLLSNRSQAVLADNNFGVVDRRPTPRSPLGWALTSDERFLFVSGELSHQIFVYRVGPRSLTLVNRIPLNQAASVRDLAYLDSQHSLYAVEDYDHRLIKVVLSPDWQTAEEMAFRESVLPLGGGPVRLKIIDDHLFVDLLLDHTLLIVPLASGGPQLDLAIRIEHQGPLWSFAAAPLDDGMLLALGGIENRPLDRTQGEFGFVDSYLFLYRLARKAGVLALSEASPVEVNLSELGILTPKAMIFARHDQEPGLWVSGFGGFRLAFFGVSEGMPRLKKVLEAPPGISDFSLEATSGNLVFASPLVDHVGRIASNGRVEEHDLGLSAPSTAPQEADRRLGELLFFTELLTPANRSGGPLSRFSCEACHFEGLIDGRIHYTGRAEIDAVTKTMRGLANNVPLFSRGGDDSLSSMVMAEFKAANQERRDEFVLPAEVRRWLPDQAGSNEISTLELRRSFLTFFSDFRHRPHPWRLRFPGLSPLAREGLKVFRDHCARCHLPIESTRHADRPVAFSEWESWLTDPDRDLVWGAPFFSRTGIEPYVSPAGARVPSLRRTWQKRPYFTNGSSKGPEDVLRRFRYRDLAAWHHFDPQGDLEAESVQALTKSESERLLEILKYF